MRSPDYRPLLWAHHEKLVIIDQSIAFFGGECGSQKIYEFITFSVVIYNFFLKKKINFFDPTHSI